MSELRKQENIRAVAVPTLSQSDMLGDGCVEEWLMFKAERRVDDVEAWSPTLV